MGPVSVRRLNKPFKNKPFHDDDGDTSEDLAYPTSPHIENSQDETSSDDDDSDSESGWSDDSPQTSEDDEAALVKHRLMSPNGTHRRPRRNGTKNQRALSSKGKSITPSTTADSEDLPEVPFDDKREEDKEGGSTAYTTCASETAARDIKNVVNSGESSRKTIVSEKTVERPALDENEAPDEIGIVPGYGSDRALESGPETASERRSSTPGCHVDAKDLKDPEQPVSPSKAKLPTRHEFHVKPDSYFGYRTMDASRKAVVRPMELPPESQVWIEKEKEKQEKEKQEQEQLERERQEQEQIEKERKEQERLQRVKERAEQAEKENKELASTSVEAARAMQDPQGGCVENLPPHVTTESSEGKDVPVEDPLVKESPVEEAPVEEAPVEAEPFVEETKHIEGSEPKETGDGDNGGSYNPNQASYISNDPGRDPNYSADKDPRVSESSRELGVHKGVFPDAEEDDKAGDEENELHSNGDTNGEENTDEEQAEERQSFLSNQTPERRCCLWMAMCLTVTLVCLSALVGGVVGAAYLGEAKEDKKTLIVLTPSPSRGPTTGRESRAPVSTFAPSATKVRTAAPSITRLGAPVSTFAPSATKVGTAAPSIARLETSAPSRTPAVSTVAPSLVAVVTTVPTNAPSASLMTMIPSPGATTSAPSVPPVSEGGGGAIIVIPIDTPAPSAATAGTPAPSALVTISSSALASSFPKNPTLV